MLIGLTGKKQSGKDTAAGFLVEKGWVKIGFADPMRECLHALNPMVYLDQEYRVTFDYREAVGVHGYDVAKERYPEFRRLLQVFGTEVGRNILGKYLGNPWLQIASIRIQQALLEGKNVVISDVRFDDEAELIHKLGGKVLQVFRDATYQSNDQHVSEQGVSDHLLDHTIINNDSPGHLRQYVLRLVAGLEREAMEQPEYDPKDVAFGSNREDQPIGVKHVYTFTDPNVISVTQRRGRTEYYLEAVGPVTITEEPVYAEEYPEAEPLALNEEEPPLIERMARDILEDTFQDRDAMFDIGEVVNVIEILIGLFDRLKRCQTPDEAAYNIKHPRAREYAAARWEVRSQTTRAQFRAYGVEMADAIIQRGKAAPMGDIHQLLSETA